MPIRDQHKYKKLEVELKNLKSLRYVKPFLSLFGSKGRNAAKAIGDSLEKVPELEAELDKLRNMPDRFNAVFRDLGWIASDDMNIDAMEEAVSIAINEGIENAETFLVKHYNDGVIDRWLKIFCLHPYMESRKKLLELALDDHNAGRFHASVPVVLSQIDGITYDLANQTFYRKDRDKAEHLTATETIVGDPDGLATLAEIVSIDRRITSDGPINIPYRHGILHGRDIGYDNLVVSTKSFAILLALRTWALQVIKNEQFVEPPIDYLDPEVATWDDVKREWEDLKQVIQNYSESRNQET